MAKGNAVQLIAQGMYSDGSSVDISSSVAWTSSNTDIVTVTADGLATGVTEGIIAVEASKDSIESNTANVTVTSAV
ncbi:Ig-like domain-containing protein, partial [Aliivibrio fischeri]